MLERSAWLRLVQPVLNALIDASTVAELGLTRPTERTTASSLIRTHAAAAATGTIHADLMTQSVFKAFKLYPPPKKKNNNNNNTVRYDTIRYDRKV